MANTFTQARLTLPADQTLAAIVSLIRQNAGENYFVYERAPRWYIGLGKKAQLTISPDGSQAMIESAQGTASAAIKTSLATCARQFTAQYAAQGQRVFGMAGFNYAAKIRNLAFTPGSWPLLSLTVVRDELIIEEGEVTIYAENEARCQRLCQQLQAILPTEQGKPVQADLTAQGDDYQQRVNRALEEIALGDYTKVIVARALVMPHKIDMSATLWRGRLANTPARSFLLKQGELEATGFSPEMVVTVEKGFVTSEPLAGTRARSDSAGENVHNRAELQSDSKEIVEHVISVKAAIEELELLCCAQSVVVSDLMSVRERGSVQHLGSQVRGELAPGYDAWDAFDVLFPAITASGIPKIPALEAILRLEAVPRELYSGAVLMLEGEQLFEAALVLRSAFQDQQRSWIQAGAGVIAQSNALRELTETCEKLSSVAPFLVRREENDKN
ncbi:salicylate synthase [Serratia symbiotica]|uniref:Salicylate synthase n=1 Tax=Serratia symbiotica TaxID=138074 RepID=A0A068Z3F9_9GAMM|nr:salicylate synthase [Serratia symbiotica]QLH62592.1 salicylate synthase [Serratia symbiotica]CDS58296.1 Salicylate synthase [Serratia symbiotica]